MTTPFSRRCTGQTQSNDTRYSPAKCIGTKCEAIQGGPSESKAHLHILIVLDWSQCPAVESVLGKVSGAWVFKGSRTPVSVVFENLEDGMTIDEVIDQFPVTREQVKAVLEFAARNLDAPVTVLRRESLRCPLLARLRRS